MSETNARPAGAPEASTAPDRVVVGVDGSRHSLRALDRGVEEAALRGATLEVLCGGVPPRRSVVPETDGDRERAREATRKVAEEAAEYARERDPSLTVVASGVADPAPDALVRASREAALTVVGTRGHGGFRGLLLGSVSLRLAAHAAGPLLIVRGESTDAPTQPREIVVGLKWSGGTEPVEFAFEEAAREGAHLRVVHAWTYPILPGVALKLPPKEPTEEGERAEEFLQATVEPFRERFPAVRLTAEQHRGATAEHLIDLSGSADMVVLGVRREHRRLGLQVGPVVNAVIQHGRCSVALVPSM